VRVQIIRHARTHYVGKYQLCMFLNVGFIVHAPVLAAAGSESATKEQLSQLEKAKAKAGAVAGAARAKVAEVDGKHGISDKAAAAAGVARAKATEIDERYKVRERAGSTAEVVKGSAGAAKSAVGGGAAAGAGAGEPSDSCFPRAACLLLPCP